MKLLKYHEVILLKDIDINIFKKRSKDGYLYPSDTLVNDINKYWKKYPNDIKYWIDQIDKQWIYDEEKRIIILSKVEAIKLLSNLMNKYESYEEYTLENDCSREKLLNYLSGHILNEIRFFGETKGVIAVYDKNNKLIDYDEYFTENDGVYKTFPDERYEEKSVVELLIEITTELLSDQPIDSVKLFVFRTIKNLSIREFAEKVGLSRGIIQMMESGERKIQTTTKEKIIKTFNLTPSEIELYF